MKSLKEVIEYLIKEGTKVRDKYAAGIPMELDYVCIFSQDENEFDYYNKEASKIGVIAENTSTGIIYAISKELRNEFRTNLIKIRVVDSARPQRGDLDFAISDYDKYKEQLLKKGANLIKRTGFEMLEFIDKDFDSLLYFSNPPVSKVLAKK